MARYAGTPSTMDADHAATAALLAANVSCSHGLRLVSRCRTPHDAAATHHLGHAFLRAPGATPCLPPPRAATLQAPPPTAFRCPRWTLLDMPAGGALLPLLLYGLLPSRHPPVAIPSQRDDACENGSRLPRAPPLRVPLRATRGAAPRTPAYPLPAALLHVSAHTPPAHLMPYLHEHARDCLYRYARTFTALVRSHCGAPSWFAGWRRATLPCYLLLFRTGALRAYLPFPPCAHHPRTAPTPRRLPSVAAGGRRFPRPSSSSTAVHL